MIRRTRWFNAIRSIVTWNKKATYAVVTTAFAILALWLTDGLSKKMGVEFVQKAEETRQRQIDLTTADFDKKVAAEQNRSREAITALLSKRRDGRKALMARVENARKGLQGVHASARELAAFDYSNSAGLAGYDEATLLIRNDEVKRSSNEQAAINVLRETHLAELRKASIPELAKNYPGPWSNTAMRHWFLNALGLVSCAWGVIAAIFWLMALGTWATSRRKRQEQSSSEIEDILDEAARKNEIQDSVEPASSDVHNAEAPSSFVPQPSAAETMAPAVTAEPAIVTPIETVPAPVQAATLPPPPPYWTVPQPEEAVVPPAAVSEVAPTAVPAVIPPSAPAEVEPAFVPMGRATGTRRPYGAAATEPPIAPLSEPPARAEPIPPPPAEVVRKPAKKGVTKKSPVKKKAKK